ncbi:P-type ATPase (P-ATPase) Superfamily, partial [Pseudoloma neurophilia]
EKNIKNKSEHESEKNIKTKKRIFTHNHRKWIVEGNKIRKCKADVHRDASAYKNCLPFDLEIHQKNCLKIDIPSWSKLIYEHFTAPFFVFQIFCGILWCLDEYIYHSLFTLVMLFVFEIGVIFSRRVTMKHYRSMEQKEVKIKKVKFSDKDFSTEMVSSVDLLPGDVLLIEKAIKIPADLIILKGACAVNEAMLTGESLPNYKEDISELDGIFERQKKHTIFSGTEIVKIDPVIKIIQETAYKIDKYTFDEHCLVVMVIETGFNTQQGKLIRKMMNSNPPDNTEAYLFLGFLLIFAIISSIIVLYQSLQMKKTNYKIFLEIILILTNVVPPELPLELTIAVNAAVQKLLTLGVFCLEPFRIVNAGKVTVACFDKTGTLTESNMVLYKAVSKNEKSLKEVALTCHSILKDDKNELIGDPLEISAFEHFNGILITDTHIRPGTSDKTVENKSTSVIGLSDDLRIVKKFHFSSNLRRMSVIFRKGSNHFVGMKGAPETVEKYLDNIPIDYNEYQKFAKQGFRVLAIASRRLKIYDSKMTREQIEQAEFEFHGFLLYKSKLKDESLEVISSLQTAGIKIVMITGDNSLTAISVAKSLNFYNDAFLEGEEINKYLDLVESNNFKADIPKGDDNLKDKAGQNENMIKDITESGFVRQRDVTSTFTEIERFSDAESSDKLFDDKLASDLTPSRAIKFLKNVTVFARADPKHKERLIRFFKNQQSVTLMCGDGTNDVGALNESDVGIALLTTKDGQKSDNKKQPESFAEALRNEMIEGKVNLGDACVAAPFTIRNNLLTSVLSVIRQGRSTLVTTFQMYKILALNSLITAYSLSFLDSCGVRFSDAQVTITGILLAFSFMFLTKCEPLEKISRQRPISNIFNWYFISSILSQTAVHLVITAILVFYVGKPETYEEKFTPSLLNSSLYILNTFQQVSTFMINYIGRPFREDFLENAPLRNSLILCLAFIIVLLLELHKEVNKYIEIVDLGTFKWLLLALVIADWLGCYIFEKLCAKMLIKKRRKRNE